MRSYIINRVSSGSVVCPDADWCSKGGVSGMQHRDSFCNTQEKNIILLTKRIIIVSRVFSVNHPQLNHRLFETRIKRIEGIEDLTDEAKYILIAVQPKKYTACCILLKQAKCFLTQDMSINLVCNVVHGIKMLRPRDDVRHDVKELQNRFCGSVRKNRFV